MDCGIAVADGQCMMIVEQGKIVEFCAEPGEFTYDSSTEPSIFSGSFGESVKQTFGTIGKRFTFGGDTAKDQRVYYFNTKELIDNKFGMTFKNSEKKNWRTLRATSIDKFNDLEEATQKALRDTHYDTYENRKYTEEKNVKIGSCTFNVLHVTTDFSEKDYFITFAKRGEKDVYGLFVQLEVNKKYIAANDPIITEILKSVSIITEK